MLKSSPPYAIWSIWVYLPFLQKLLFLALCVLGMYALFSAALTVVRLRAIAKMAQQKEDITSIRRALTALRKRSTKLQQTIGAAFYLSGGVLFMGFQWAYFTIENSSTPVGSLILENLEVHFAFAANVFFAFLILHFIQWFISNLVNAHVPNLNAPEIA